MFHRGLAVLSGMAIAAALAALGSPAATAAASETCTTAFISDDALVVWPVQSDGAISFTATATGCTNPEFKFYLQRPGGSWLAVTAYGVATWTFGSEGFGPGVFGIGVWARQIGSTAPYQAYYLGTFSLAGACAVTWLSTAVLQPVPSGTTVVFNGGASPCPRPEFRFWVQKVGGAWALKRDWGGADFTWNTKGLSSGSYLIGIWARQSGSSKAYEAYAVTTFVLAPGGGCNVADELLTPESPQAPGQEISLEAASNCGLNAEFEFWDKAPGATAWKRELGYSTNRFAVWHTTGAKPGTYLVGVHARIHGLPGVSYQAYFIGSYVLDVVHCSAAKLTQNIEAPQPAGAVITYIALSAGCVAPNYRFWVQSPSGAWSSPQAYSTNGTFQWDTTHLAPGQYRVGVWIRQNGSAASFDTYAITTFWVTA